MKKYQKECRGSTSKSYKFLGGGREKEAQPLEARARVWTTFTHREAVRIFLDFSSDKWAGAVAFCA